MKTIEVENQQDLDAVPHDPKLRVIIRAAWSESIVLERKAPDAAFCAYGCIVTVRQGNVDVFDGAAIVRGKGAEAVLHGNSRGSCSDGGRITVCDESTADILSGGYALLEGSAAGRVFSGGRAKAAGASRVNVQMGGYAELCESATGTVLCRGSAVGYNCARMIVAPGAYVKRGERGGIAAKGITLERLRLEGVPRREPKKKEKPSGGREEVSDGQEVFQ